ncbi:LlaJI family restriction endonuclease [Enterococcus faecalis]|nr:LlaJI family restriction endonuclease [Enterococcus faecalis]
MSLVILKELECYTANVDLPHKESDLIVQLGLADDINRYHAIVKELNNTTFLKHRKPSTRVSELTTNYSEDEEEEVPKEFKGKETFQFTFVGIVVVMGVTIAIYPKHVGDIQLDKINEYRKFKQILRVIYQYQKRQEQQIILSSDELVNQENQLGIAIQLLNYYSEYGLYRVEKTLTELNGEGEINWFKTINEVPIVLSGKSPVYIDPYTDRNITDEQNIIRQIQLATMNSIKEEYNDILLLLDYDVPSEDSVLLSDLGDGESLFYHLDNELRVQFISHKIELITLLKLYIQSKTRDNEVEIISTFGVTKFDRVWEDVCKVVYGDNLEDSLKTLGLKYKKYPENTLKLKDVVPKPIWTNLINGEEYNATKSLELDVLHVNKASKTFEIYDGKYYLISFENNKIKGQPGVGDITKQYLYELTFKELANENGYHITNKFIVPIDDIINDNKEIASISLPIFDSENLSAITVLARECGTIFGQYLN